MIDLRERPQQLMFYVGVGEAGLGYMYLPAGINNSFETSLAKKKQLKIYLKRKWEVKVAGDLITVCLANRN